MTLPIAEARKNDEVISLADSQIMRWIDELNDMADADSQARQVRAEIRKLRNEPNSTTSKRRIKYLYSRLDEIQFKPDYLCVIIDKEKDYHRACRGFSVNGIQYVRLLGTSGGIKNRTIVFVSERLAPELRRRIENGRDPDMALVPAKLEAYKALVCSASIPVSFPHGILVVNDCETNFLSDIIYLNDEGDGEPVMEERKQEPITINASDGCGMMSPALAERWSEELGLGYLVSGVNTRFSWEKGMVFTFDFHEFADKVAKRYLVQDAWGDWIDIRDVELILTTSMVKLWDSYKSCSDYFINSINNGYTFGVAKTCPEELESERGLNYQFIQSYELDDDDIEELISPTLQEIKEITSEDRIKAILYLRGLGITERNVAAGKDDYVKAIMIEPKMMDDPYVRSCIYHMIHHRIDQAKVGVLKVHGNYSIAGGDLYALCQHIFGLPVTGLLKAGEVYNKYWVDRSVESLACFRAPMTCHNNIRLVHPSYTKESAYWFRYIKTCTIFNAWDTAMPALNGMDFDSDSVMLTDNSVLVRRLRPLPALMCVQRKAEKRVATEEDLVWSNISSFGDDIGKTTNWITSMFDVRARFDKDTAEYKELDYRIKCGQLFQQNAIDKAKGIIAKPMPREWHDRYDAGHIEDPEQRYFYQQIVADKKPYFMRYIYPKLMRQYNKFIKNTHKNALREFGKTIAELYEIPAEKRTYRQKEFLYNYERNIPISSGDCVVNKICRRFEQEFDGYLKRQNKVLKFDYSLLKSGVEYSASRYSAIEKLYRNYNQRLQGFVVFSKYERVDDFDYNLKLSDLRNDFIDECTKACPNRFVLCDIVLDICYKKSSTKRFAWDMCGKEIIHNLLVKNNGYIAYPERDEDGDIEFCGARFSVRQKKIGGIE